ncbi:MAG TPA: glycosyltransferase, partial [Vicinamibacterales bacterium]|nr:glycosyltransferase [Vicinamibacterales bacterium]
MRPTPGLRVLPTGAAFVWNPLLERPLSNPTVTVAICMHNGSRYIAETLDSVFAQTLQDFEIVLVDDGSTDNSIEIVQNRFKDHRLRIVQQRQQTLRVARPVVVAHARGEFIAFIDHDDVWLPEKLERQTAVASAEPETALVFSNCFLIDASGRTIGKASDQHNLAAVDLTPPHGHLELLRRG